MKEGVKFPVSVKGLAGVLTLSSIYTQNILTHQRKKL